MTITMLMEFIRHELKKVGKDDVVAIYEMRKPSDLPSTYRPSKLPQVQLELKEKGNDFQFEVMHMVRHKNILRLEAIEEIEVAGQKMLAVFVEPHNGPFIVCLAEMLADKGTRAVPSQALRDLVRQMIDGVDVLRINDLYHGDLSVYNIYYFMENHVNIIKLANFRQKNAETDLKTAQLLDWVGMGHVLVYISNGAKLLNAGFSCSVIDHLASKLLALTDIMLLPDLKKNILSGPFFWDPRRRTQFYVHDMPSALNDATFVERVESYAHWQLPWNSNPHNGLVAAMDAYRTTKLNLKAYDGTDPIANIRCMSGAYTHQDKLEGKILDDEGCRMSVDSAVQQNQTDLTLILYRLLTGEVAAEEAAAAAAAEEAAAAAAAAAPQ